MSLEHGGWGGEGCPGQTGKGQSWRGSLYALYEKGSRRPLKSAKDKCRPPGLC